MTALAAKADEGCFVNEAEQDEIANPLLEQAPLGRAKLKRVMDATGYEVAG